MATKADKMTFEEIMARLDEIALELENGKSTLDHSLDLYSEGVKLLKSANTMLDNAEKKVLSSKAATDTDSE